MRTAQSAAINRNYCTVAGSGTGPYTEAAQGPTARICVVDTTLAA